MCCHSTVAPVIHIEFVLLEETLGCGILGLDSGHEFVELPPLLPNSPRHVLRDLKHYRGCETFPF